MSTLGVHSMPWEDYAKAEGINGSMLNILLDECPAVLADRMTRREEIESKPKEFGTWFHRFVLEPDTLESAYYVQPDRVFVERARRLKLKALPILEDGKEVEDSQARIALPWNGNLGECKEWLSAHSDRPIIPAGELEDIRGMVQSLKANEEFMRLFRGGISEQSLFAEDMKGTLRKGRLDRLHGAGNYILDLKSCVSAHPAKFSKTILDYRYYRKAAFYIDLARLCGLNKDAFVFVAVEKTPPYISAVYPLGERSLMKGVEEVERGMEQYRRCLATGIWPAYPMQDLDCPEWALRNAA